MDHQSAEEIVRDVFRAWYPVLVRYARHFAQDIDAAEDAAQEAFMQLHRDLMAGKSIEHPKAWLLTVVRRKASVESRVHRRSNLLYTTLEILDSLPNARVEPEQHDSDLSRFLSVLSERELEVVLLRMESMKYREIAAELNISSKSVCTLLTRALKKFQRAAGAKSGGDSIADHVDKTFPETLQ